MTGYPLEQLILLDPAQIFHHDTPESFQQELIGKMPVAQDSRWQAELLSTGGRTLWAEIEQTSLVWNNQPALLLLVRDISEQKVREQMLEEERARLEEEYLTLRSTIKERYRFGELVGKSPAMQRVYELIVNTANAGMNVLIYGESGTGKELIARTLHQVNQRRKEQPFVPVNCASIPENLFEREFFGHRKGAFTGADKNTAGLFDRAHRGTLFLDEVTELSPDMQAKLLRVLQDGEYLPLGSTTPKQANVVIVAATNKNWQEEIAAKRLREDFFYRIGVIEIHVPPLRERKEDLRLLVEHILDQYRRKYTEEQGNAPQDLPTDQSMLPGELIQALYAYHWPGNIRELQNVIQRYVLTHDLNAVLSLIAAFGSRHTSSVPDHTPTGLHLPEYLKAVEKQIIADTLLHNHHHITRTAKQLGVPLRTLHRKIKTYRLMEKDEKIPGM